MDPAIDTARGIATSTLASHRKRTSDGEARTRPNPENAAVNEDISLLPSQAQRPQTKNAKVARRSWNQIIHFEAHLRAGSFDWGSTSLVIGVVEIEQEPSRIDGGVAQLRDLSST
jgi:hypothetical protein